MVVGYLHRLPMAIMTVTNRETTKDRRQTMRRMEEAAMANGDSVAMHWNIRKPDAPDASRNNRVTMTEAIICLCVGE